MKCSTCDGCGKIANDEESSPWTYWEALEPPSNLMVTMGFVFPIPCPDCNGRGEREEGNNALMLTVTLYEYDLLRRIVEDEAEMKRIVSTGENVLMDSLLAKIQKMRE